MQNLVYGSAGGTSKFVFSLVAAILPVSVDLLICFILFSKTTSRKVRLSLICGICDTYLWNSIFYWERELGFWSHNFLPISCITAVPRVISLNIFVE